MHHHSLPGAWRLSMRTNDGLRYATVVPAEKVPAPCVLVLHGSRGSGEGAARTTGFAEAAAWHRFTAVFPDGLDGHWHDARYDDTLGPDDEGFLRALCLHLIGQELANPSRVYLAGISNGGAMAFTMACRYPSLFQGIGTVIANMPARLDPRRTRPVPFVMVNGTDDPVMPYEGGEVGVHGGRGHVLGVEEAADLIARVHGCARAPVVERLPHFPELGETTVMRLGWIRCRRGASVTVYRVEGGGHAIPGRPSQAPVLLGPTNHDIVAATVIMDAFAGTSDAVSG